MPQGMQVFDAGGRLLIDTSTLVGNFINSFTTTKKNGSITSSLLTTGVPFAFASTGSVPVSESNAPSFNEAPVWPTITINGNTLSWSWGEDSSVSNNRPITIFFGVF